MASKALEEVIKKAESLDTDEQLLLIARVTEMLRGANQVSKPRRKWSEICGTAPYPLLGEDAQAWVSRTRRESDERREKQLKREL